ncbi:MAG: YetF domain-containing protein [Opitutaceae bacterium]
MLSHLFDLPIPILEKILRSILVYFFLIALLRAFGKRELAQLTPFDLIVLLMLSNTIQNAIIGDDNTLTGGMLGAIALLAVNYATVHLTFRHPRLDRLFGGSPATLIQNGKLSHAALDKEALTERELRMAANRQGIDDLHEVEHATLEPNGAFSFEKRPHSAADSRYAELSAKIDELTLLLKTK